MNISILVAFVLVIGSSLVMIMYKQITLAFKGVNKYDLETLPKQSLLFTFSLSAIVLVTSLSVLLYQLSLQTDPIYDYIMTWIQSQ
jgi:hypothetical protein